MLTSTTATITATANNNSTYQVKGLDILCQALLCALEV